MDNPRGKLNVSSQTSANQAVAADPTRNVWVKANAGSGKTFVLSRRVLRLLINKVPPEEILCLTYTKAAAAEMRARVGKELGSWAVYDDQKLLDEIEKLEGEKPSDEKLAFARQLFARALETPGGLKINTIHAFSESVLHRFPLEAGVPFDFKVIDDAEQTQLLVAAREEVLANRDGDADLQAAIDKLFDIESDFGLEKAINAALGHGAKLPMVIANQTRAKTLLSKLLSLSADTSLEALTNEICNSPHLPISEYKTVHEELTHLGVAKRFNAKLTKQLSRPNTPENILSTFLSAEGKMPGKGHEAHSGVAKHDPALAERLQNETERLFGLSQSYLAAKTVEHSLALLDVLTALYARYTAKKRARSLLDFDDLIIHLRQLLEHSEFAAWIAYKLDAGISHILVDESQDTNPEQWRIVEALLNDFFDGESAIERPRSVFAVGDEKQSIFSFQGAEPRLFPETGRKLGLQALTAKKPWSDITLKTSFRTVRTILEAVDLVFARPEAHRGLTGDDEKTVHEAAREMDGGRVQIWPAIEKPDEDEQPEGYAVEAKVPRARPEEMLANKVASTIEEWIATGRRIGVREQLVKPQDILILVQSRGPAFRAMIRALKQKGLPNLGEDKLVVSNHIAIEDLLVLAEFLLNPADDLALATVLRSPLFSWSENQLFDLARGTRGGNPRMVDQRAKWPLWVQLKEAAMQQSDVKNIFETLNQWRNRVDLERPYEFFAHILFEQGGLKKFHARLGVEVDDVINEFLNMALSHEQGDQPAMLGFVTDMRQNQSQIKRELSEAGGAIRVMTVHGAKGLEAPIVFVLDATVAPTGAQNAKPILLNADHEKPQDAYLLWAQGSSKKQAEIVSGLKDSAKAEDDAEYRRKLYVALTRAEDELYITGVAKKGQEKSWHQMVLDGLQEHCREIKDADGNLTCWQFPANLGDPLSGAKCRNEEDAAEAPAWFTTAAPVPAVRRILEPSAHDEDFVPKKGKPSGDAELARLKGTSLHALLQFLPQFPIDQREKLAHQALLNLMPEHKALHSDMVGRALEIIGAPQFGAFFGENARAEVAVAADIEFEGKPTRITGRIDCLVVNDEEVKIVDFKSDANPPGDGSTIPVHYRQQLERYRAVLRKQFPNRPINCAILWTENLTISEMLDSEF